MALKTKKAGGDKYIDNSEELCLWLAREGSPVRGKMRRPMNTISVNDPAGEDRGLGDE